MATCDDMKKFWAIGKMLKKMTPVEREPVLQKCITEHIDKVLAAHGVSRAQLTQEKLERTEADVRALLIKEWRLNA